MVLITLISKFTMLRLPPFLEVVRVAQPPLPGETRLDGNVGAFGVAHGVLVRLGLHQGAEFLEQLLGHRAGLETFDAGERIVVPTLHALGEGRLTRAIAAKADGAKVVNADIQSFQAVGAKVRDKYTAKNPLIKAFYDQAKGL